MLFRSVFQEGVYPTRADAAKALSKGALHVYEENGDNAFLPQSLSCGTLSQLILLNLAEYNIGAPLTSVNFS